MPDPALIGEGLKRLGFAPTADNIRRASEMIYSNPAILNRLMGVQGGTGGESGEDSSVMLSQLDKLVGDSASGVQVGPTTGAPLPQAPLPENMESRGTSSPAPVSRSPIIDKRQLSNSPPSSNGLPPPLPSDSAPVAPGSTGSEVEGTSGMPPSSGTLDWLRTLLGISAAGGGAAAAGQRALTSGSPTSLLEPPKNKDAIYADMKNINRMADLDMIKEKYRLTDDEAMRYFGEANPSRPLPAPEERLRLTGPTESARIPGPKGPMSLPPPGSVEALMLNTARPQNAISRIVGQIVDNEKPGMSTGNYDGRPTNTGDPERITPPADRPTNLEGTPQRKGPYDGRPTNLENGKEALIRALKRARR